MKLTRRGILGLFAGAAAAAALPALPKQPEPAPEPPPCTKPHLIDYTFDPPPICGHRNRLYDLECTEPKGHKGVHTAIRLTPPGGQMRTLDYDCTSLGRGSGNVYDFIQWTHG